MALGANRGSPAARAPLALLAMVVVVPLLQMIPLPPSIWVALPGQAPRLEALHLARLPLPWLPLSLSRSNTRGAALALIPPVAVFVAGLSLEEIELRRLAWLWIISAVAGLSLGIVQVASPAGGPAYAYSTTNLASLVGFFANRNHEAAFLLALLPIAAALSTTKVAAARHHAEQTGVAAPWLAWPFILISFVALGVIRSRAGVILAAPAALLTLAVAWRSRRSLNGGPLAAIAAAIGLASLAVALFGLGPILGRFAKAPAPEFRLEAWPHVITAARSYLPLGSGLGSFDRVFEAFEPLSLIGPKYFNHAHNDYLELWLETGWVAAIALALFLVWFLLATWTAWRSGSALAQAASAAIALLMVESLVDYPLRTETLAVLFAFCCVLLVRRPTS